MRKYLEALEHRDIEAEFVRIDVTDYSETEVAQIRVALEELMAGVAYSLRMHFCRHDDGQSCQAEKL